MGIIRRPNTAQERRANEGSPYVRAKRKGHNLPSDWDDIHKGFGRSWKRYRRKQYKEIGG
jgi:hypothetical protein